MKFLKKLPIVILMVGMIIGSFGNTAQAATWKDLTILNTTGKTITEVYLVISGYETWGKDLLGESILQNGSTKKIRFDTDYSRYDFKIVFDDGKSITWKGNNALTLTGRWRLTIYYKPDTKKYSVIYN